MTYPGVTASPAATCKLSTTSLHSGLILTPSSAASTVCIRPPPHNTSTFTDFLPMPQRWYHPQTMVVCIRGIPFHRSIPCQQHWGGQGDAGPGSVGRHLALQDRHLGHRKERWQGRWMGRDRQKNAPGSRTTSLTDHPADQS